MKVNRWNWKPRSERAGESGQSIVFVLLVLGVFLLGALCFAFDLSNMWFHRQAAQSAADAACAAGAMDILVDDTSGVTNQGGFTPTLGTSYACASTPTDSVCKYAKMNGYTGNVVNVSFPTAPPGVTAPPTGIAPYAFIRVDIVDHVQTFFAGLLNGGTTADVRAFSTCGVEQAAAPIPMIVLDPRVADGVTLKTFGTAGVAIYGGPSQSIQVNSYAKPAVNIQGSATIDLSHGGPAATGSDLGVKGGPAAAPSGFLPGTTGAWISPSTPINDPFAQVVAPAQPTNVPTSPKFSLLPGVGECPNVTRLAGCDVYEPGYYSSQLQIKGAGGNNFTLSLFEPGIYYIVGGLTAAPNSCLRPSTATGDGSGGTMFYFADTNSVSVGSNSGDKCPAGIAFNTTSGTGSLPYGAYCTAAAVANGPTNLPASLTGTVLLGPCQAPTVSALCDPNCGINYGDPQGNSDPLGEQRGFLFFQDRAKNAAGNPQWTGGGNFLLSGTMYFHQCVTSGSDTGVSCQPGTGGAYNDILSLGGGSGSGTYVLGQIVVDQALLGGNSTLTMDLDSTTVNNILKASIFQ